MALSRPLVSVVVPCFNAGRMLQPALRSVIEQTYPDIEIIFVDNNSTDESAKIAREVLEASNRPFHLVGCPEPGANHARNVGYSLASGEFIQWMDADDLLEPDKIERQIAAFRSNPDIDIAYGDWTSHRFQLNGPPLLRNHTLHQENDQRLRTLAGIWYPPHLYLIKRDVADRLQHEQAWWPTCKVATDVEYSAKAALLDFRFQHVPGARVHYNIWSTEQISGSVPYEKRAASLKAIYERLKAFTAAHNLEGTLSRRHQMFLNQNWDLWHLPAKSMLVEKLPGRWYQLVQPKTKNALKVRPADADLAKALMGRPPRALLHHALMLAGSSPDLPRDPVVAFEAIDGFRQAGLLTLAALTH